MRIFVLTLFVILSLITPFFVYADCSNLGTTVIFINGMFISDKSDADASRKILANVFKAKSDIKDVNFILGYNPSHVAGIDDVVSFVKQAYNGGRMDYDLATILRQIHSELKTQRILLIGHSQGTFYTNAAYDYLVAHGVDKDSIAVYNVATPADFVAGSEGHPGKYLTSSTDRVISSIVKELAKIGSARRPLPPNISLKLPLLQVLNPLAGHSFTDVYLAEAPDRIIGDMDSEIGNLSAGSDKNNCFVQPKADSIGNMLYIVRFDLASCLVVLNP